MNDIDIIVQQTGISDLDLVREVYNNTKGSIPDAIMQLMSYKYCAPAHVKQLTTMDYVREIVSSKEEVYYKLLSDARQTT